MSIRSRKLFVLFGMLSLAAMASACDHKPVAGPENEEYCDQNPNNCETPSAR